MIRARITGVALFATFLAACGPGQVVVTAEIDMLDPETSERVVRPLSDLRVQLVPFDRDFLFDSLTAAAPTPEPQLPGELAQAREEIQRARLEWSEAESQWLALRDRLQQITEETRQYNQAEARYRELVSEFDRLDAQYRNAESRKDEAFARFDQLQQETFAELERFSAGLMAWEDEAFADFDLIVSERLRGARLQILVDTTDATGRAQLAVPPGEWWVHARFPEATDELYWNERIAVERGDPVEMRLTRQNAEVRPIF